MAQDLTLSVMQRILRKPEPEPEAQQTPTRALRQALSRAAEDSVGLHLFVLGVRLEEAGLDDLLGRLEGDLMLLGVADGGDRSGFVGIDPETRAAIVEIQTLGRVSPAKPLPRRVTAADRALAEPFVTVFLRELAAETAGTSLGGWSDGFRTNGFFPSPREIGLALPDGDYRVVRMTLDLGAGGRQGLLVLVLPVPREEVAPDPVTPAREWSAALAGNVMSAPADVRAILHRIRLPLRMVEAFELGQLITLPGVSVGKVRVETPDDTLVSYARLGQMGGMRAVRLGKPGQQDMQDAMPLPTVAGPGSLVVTGQHDDGGG
jgi:flagellar motor switch protein FliM